MPHQKKSAPKRKPSAKSVRNSDLLGLLRSVRRDLHKLVYELRLDIEQLRKTVEQPAPTTPQQRELTASSDAAARIYLDLVEKTAVYAARGAGFEVLVTTSTVPLAAQPAFVDDVAKRALQLRQAQ